VTGALPSIHLGVGSGVTGRRCGPRARVAMRALTQPRPRLLRSPCSAPGAARHRQSAYDDNEVAQCADNLSCGDSQTDYATSALWRLYQRRGIYARRGVTRGCATSPIFEYRATCSPDRFDGGDAVWAWGGVPSRFSPALRHCSPLRSSMGLPGGVLVLAPDSAPKRTTLGSVYAGCRAERGRTSGGEERFDALRLWRHGRSIPEKYGGQP
jgi:hypothetical protein